MAAAVYPRSVIIKPYGMKHSYWSYKKIFKDVPDAVILDSMEGRYNPDARIEVEPSKVHSRYVHLRFFNANKYCRWYFSGLTQYIIADFDHPEEDPEVVLSTLFEVVKADDDGYVYLIHVFTKLRAQYVDGFIGFGIAEDITDDSDKMLLVDWEPQKTTPSSVAATFPRFIMLKPYSINNGCWAHVDELKGFPHSVILETDQGLHNPHAKIEIEPAKSDTRYVHLRFCNANKYCSWSNSEGKFVIADSEHPLEVLSDPSCTLFEPVKADEDGYMYLIHVYSKLRAQYHSRSGRIVLGEKSSGGLDKMLFVDWESVLKLPEHVAFKDDNGKYLQVIDKEGHPYLQFSSEDPYEKASGFRVYNRPDGYVRIKSDLLGKFWRRSPNWIWADVEDDGDGIGSFDDLEDAFWPIKIDENTIVLRNKANDNYCKGLATEGKTDCLNAAVSTATKETRMQLVELVQERKVFRVLYRTDEAQILDKTPFVAGKTTVINREDKAASMEVEIGYEDERSYTFNRSASLSVGVTTSIEAGLPGIFTASIAVSIQISTTLEWGRTTTEKTSIIAKGIVNVPPNSMAVVHYVGTKATCNVPFSYVQQDKSSINGKFVYTALNDGIYTGVNCFDFDFIVDESLELDQAPTKPEMLLGGR